MPTHTHQILSIATGTATNMYSPRQVPLKKTETVDKSGPVIDSDVKVGKSAMPDVMAGVKAGAELKKVETVDKSAPAIEKDTKIAAAPQKDVFLAAAAEGRRKSTDATK